MLIWGFQAIGSTLLKNNNQRHFKRKAVKLELNSFPCYVTVPTFQTANNFNFFVGMSVEYQPSKKNGGKLLVINGIRFFRNRKRGDRQYWKCSHYYKQKCPTIVVTHEGNPEMKILHCHNHPVVPTSGPNSTNYFNTSKCGVDFFWEK